MVQICKYCGKRYSISVDRFRRESKNYCSQRCFFKKRISAFVIISVIGFVMVIVASILALIDLDDYEVYFFLLMIFGGTTFVFGGIYSLFGYLFRIRDQRKEIEKPFLCIYCKGELTDFIDKGLNACTSCGKKIPSCGICKYSIFGNEEIYEVESCNHIFHRICLNEWMEKKKTCPICKTKIKQIDLDVSDKI